MSCFALLDLGMIISAHTYLTIWVYLLIYLNTLYHAFLKRSVISGVSLSAVSQKMHFACNKYCSTSVGNNLLKCFMQCTVLLDTALRAGTYPEMEFLNGIFIRGF
jgi:hypothetical protein